MAERRWQRGGKRAWNRKDGKGSSNRDLAREGEGAPIGAGAAGAREAGVWCLGGRQISSDIKSFLTNGALLCHKAIVWSRIWQRQH